MKRQHMVKSKKSTKSLHPNQHGLPVWSAKLSLLVIILPRLETHQHEMPLRSEKIAKSLFHLKGTVQRDFRPPVILSFELSWATD